jgi:hypothetical protein
MSNSDFEERLNRIRSGAGQNPNQPFAATKTKRRLPKGLFFGPIMVNAGAYLVAVINLNYESIKDQYGLAAALGLGFGSIAIIIFGVVLTIRAIGGVRKAHSERSSYAPAVYSPQASATAASPIQMQPTRSRFRWRYRFGLVILGGLGCAVGIQMARIAMDDYVVIRDEYGGGAAAGLGLGGIAIVSLGVALFIRAIFPGNTAPAEQGAPVYTVAMTRPPVQTSGGARAIFSLLGLAMGGIACFFLYFGNVVAHLRAIGEVDARTANAVQMGSAVIAFALVALALLIGFLGIFFRGLPLRRVPVFFLLGSMLLYVSFQTLRIHPLNWPSFMAEVTRQLNSRSVE